MHIQIGYYHALENADHSFSSNLEKRSYTNLCYKVYPRGLATYIATPFNRPWKEG